MKFRIFISLFFLFSCSLFSENSLPREEAKIHLHNIVLTKVNGSVISMMDVMKQMEILFRKAYPDLIQNSDARLHFYNMGWKQVLHKMIHEELMVAEAEAKEMKVSDGEVREELENRFGPNLTLALEDLGLSYDEAWKIVKNDLIVQRMTWFFIQSKAFQSVNPQMLRKSYAHYLERNPPLEEWKYQIISLRGEESKTIATKAFEMLSSHSLDKKNWEEKLQELRTQYPQADLQISQEYSATKQELSSSLQNLFKDLKEGSFSSPIVQKSRSDGKEVFRLYFLKEHHQKEAPSFEKMLPTLREELLQDAFAKESKKYFEKLRKQYGFEEKTPLLETLPEGFQPFSIE